MQHESKSNNPEFGTELVVEQITGIYDLNEIRAIVRSGLIDANRGGSAA